MVHEHTGGLRKRLATISVAVLAVVSYFSMVQPVAQAAGPLISLGKPCTASSIEGAGMAAQHACDGNLGTRWGSQFSDPQWIQVDLGQSATIDQVILRWETAYGGAFQIQTSANGTTWTSIYTTAAGTGGTQTLAVTGTGRYVRMLGTVRGTGWGYSLWEFEIYGTLGGGGGGGNLISEFQQVSASSFEGGNAPGGST